MESSEESIAHAIDVILPPKNIIAKNRRFKHLQKMIESDDDYFGEEMAKIRQPLLFHMYIGRFSNRNDGVKETATQNDLSKFLFQRIDKSEYDQRLKDQYQDHIVQTGKCFFQGQMDECAESDPQGKDIVLSPEEMEDNEDEFIRLMHDYFLKGHDQKWVNYDQIDNDQTLDDTQQIEQDNEDKYFDDDQPQTDLKGQSTYTGELDY